MLMQPVLDAVNKQFNNERYSSAIYMQLAAAMGAMNWEGFDHWFSAQANEELKHAKKMIDYMTDNSALAKLEDIPKPAVVITDVIGAFQAALEQEKKVTEQIRSVHGTARDAGDWTTASFFEWFLLEQVEEVNTLEVILQKLTTGGPVGLVILDKELGQR